MNKYQDSNERTIQRVPAADPTHKRDPGRSPGSLCSDLLSRLENSPRLMAQRAQIERMSSLASKAQSQNSPLRESRPGTGTCQLLAIAKKSDAVTKDNLAQTRENLGYYSWTHLTKNVAYSADNPNMEGISGQTSHSEHAVFEQELADDNTARHITIVTERPPCDAPTGEGCKQYFEKWETNHPGFQFTFHHIINSDEDEQKLYQIYRVASRDPRIPERK